MAKGRVIMDRERCKGCGLCTVTCPHQVLILGAQISSSGYYTAEAAAPEKCTGCTLCAVMCPDVVITVERVS